MKRLTYDYIKSEFEKRDYELLSDVYKNNAVKLKYKCDKGHMHSIRWSDFKKGHGCPYCSGTAMLTIELIRSRVAKENYFLISTKYKNVKTRLKFKCPNNHIFRLTASSWGRGNRCPYCSNRVRLKDRIPDMITALSRENYEFKGLINRKIFYICKNGHTHSILWTDWLRGVRCPYCYGNAKLTVEFIKKEFNNEGYKLLTNTYKNIYQKLNYICPNGHEHSITWNDWRNECRCWFCAQIKNSIRISGADHPNWKGGISCEPYCQDWTKEYKEFIKERDGYKCLNPYCFRNSNRLCIHHIDYDKKNCKPSNLITLCTSCNSYANKDRGWHKDWYNAIIENRYGRNYL
jgi:DNA-directed RNA polymerase subunit RPC12/RpoP